MELRMTSDTTEQLRRAMAAFGIPDEGIIDREVLGIFAESEMRRLAETVELSGQVPDPVCDLSYIPSRSEDRMRVRRTIALRQMFGRLHPSVPLWPYRAREYVKHLAWRVVHDPAASLERRLEAALRIVRAHFARSASATLRTEEPLSFVAHPGFDEYARHYLHADPSDTIRRFGENVGKELMTRFTRPDKLRIGPGKTYWDSAPR